MDSQTIMRFGGVAREARKRKRLGQVEVAKTIGISQSAISKIEAGLLESQLPVGLRLIVLLDIPVSLIAAKAQDPEFWGVRDKKRRTQH